MAEDPAAAACWFRQAAEAGNPYAICSYGDCCREGYGVEKNAALAAVWYARGLDFAVCCLALGDLYEQGEGVAKDLDQALYYYKRADRLGGAGDIPKNNIRRVEKKQKKGEAF